jgi:hypothetical protein
MTEERIYYSINELTNAKEEYFWKKNAETGKWGELQGRKGIYIINHDDEFTTKELITLIQKAIEQLQRKIKELKK